MCDWIIKTFPWCVEHIGNMSLGGQIALSLAALAAIVGAYILAYNAALQLKSAPRSTHRAHSTRGAHSTRRAHRAHSMNNLSWLIRCLNDDEPYECWMDADAWEATR